MQLLKGGGGREVEVEAEPTVAYEIATGWMNRRRMPFWMRRWK
jgi:hypothetical protein